MNIRYLNEDDVNNAFNLVQKQFDRQDEKNPKYQSQPQAIEKLKKLLDRTKTDKFYSSFEEKATALFINIIKGHYFFDGNKRLAIVITITFLVKNNKYPEKISKSSFKNKLSKLFTKEKFEDEDYFDSLSFAFYNLAVITASHKERNIKVEELEEKIKKFISFTISENVNSSAGFLEKIKPWFTLL